MAFPFQNCIVPPGDFSVPLACEMLQYQHGMACILIDLQSLEAEIQGMGGEKSRSAIFPAWSRKLSAGSPLASDKGNGSAGALRQDPLLPQFSASASMLCPGPTWPLLLMKTAGRSLLLPK